MADLQPNPDYYLPPRPKMPTYAPAELRAGEISEMPPWYRRPLGATADSVRAFGRMFGYDDFDKRTADTLDIASLASLGAPGLAAARRGVDANIARTLEQYVPAESFRGLFAPGVTKWWGDAIAPGLAFPKSARHPNPPSLVQNELSWLPRVEPGRADKFMLPSRIVPDYRAGYLDELATLKSNDNVLSATQAAERALARNPNDERAKYLLAAERQREAQQAADHADKVRRFERALDPDPRSHLSVIDGGKKADGGSVYPDMIAQALMIARALNQR